MTGDWGTTHKLKPRSFNKSFSAPTSLTVHQSILFIIAKYIHLRHRTLLRNRVWFLIITYISFLRNSVLDIEQKKLDSFLEENLCTGQIRLSKSPMVALVFFIKKKDGLLQLVQDYWALNSVTVKNRYPLPLISKLVSQLHGARYFTKLDVHWGFNNVCIKSSDEWKVAF